MATNDFVPVAPGPGANIASQATYLADPATSTGNVAGVAKSAIINKSLRQGTTMAAVLAQLIVDNTGQNAVDDGTTATLLTNLKAAIRLSHGQCRLSVASGTSLTLKPYNGNMVIVNGIPLQLPAAGISISNSGLSATTRYYVYLTGTTASPSLVLSTTGHSTAANGVETQTGDTTRTLVGMIYTNTLSQFEDSTQNKFCINWFNRRRLIAGVFGAGYTTSSISTVEVNVALRCNFLCWGDDGIYAQYAGSSSSNSVAATASAFMQIQMDGSVPGVTFNVVPVFANTASGFVTTVTTTPTEGLHFISLYWLTGGTGTITTNATAQLNITG
jgi:hypothetical protein